MMYASKFSRKSVSKVSYGIATRSTTARNDVLLSLWGVNVVSGEATGIISLTFLHISAKIFIQEFYITHYENKQYKHDNI